MIFNFVLSLFLCFSASAFDKDFKTVNDRVPLEFNLLFESLKLGIQSPAEKLQLIGIAKELDDSLGFLKKEHIFFLMKSEVIKNILEFKHQKVRSFDVTLFLINRLEEDLKKKSQYLNPFSLWIWRAVLAELNYRKKMGLISNKNFNPQLFDGPKRADAQRFAKYLNYLLPWIDKMDSLTAAEFNKFTKKVSWVVLRRLNDRSLLFKRFASTATGETKITLFNIPQNLLDLHPEQIKRMQNNESSLTLAEESQKEKTQALKEIESATTDDLSSLSEEVAIELEKKVE